MNSLMSFQFKGCAWSWRTEVYRPIFFNPNRTASLEQDTGNIAPSAFWARSVLAE
jgi:hypothetical protein